MEIDLLGRQKIVAFEWIDELIKKYPNWAQKVISHWVVRRLNKS
jgi:hypothetical protein